MSNFPTLVFLLISFLLYSAAVVNVPTHYQPWLGAPPVSHSFIPHDQATSCSTCTRFMEKALKMYDDNIRSVSFISSICKELNEDDQNACIATGDYLIKKIEGILSAEIKWTALDYCAIAHQCQVDCCSTDEIPEQIVMLLGSSLRQRHFTWATRTNTTQLLQLSATPDFSKLLSFNSSPHTYDAGGFVGFIHRVFVPKLSTNTRYYWRIGSSSSNILTPTYTFFVPTDDIGTNTNNLRLLIFGDMDLTDKSLETRAFLDRITQSTHPLYPHVVYLIGDIGYIDCVESRWKEWMNYLQTTFTERGIPLLTTPGNHENMGYSNMVGYDVRFPRGEGGLGLFYNSVNMGTLHLQSLNSESLERENKADLDSTQKNWVKNDLKSLKNRYPWIISAMHRPMYCPWENSSACSKQAEYFRGRLEQYFVKYGVDFHFSGHVHAYHRTTQVIDSIPHQSQCYTLIDNTTLSFDTAFPQTIEICEQGKPIYILSGNPGNSHSVPDLDPPPMPYTSTTLAKSGVGFLTVTTDIMKHDFYDGTSQKIVDTVIIQRKNRL